jgi:hypothetical protein
MVLVPTGTPLSADRQLAPSGHLGQKNNSGATERYRW